MKKFLFIFLLVSFLGGEVLRFTFYNSISFRLVDVASGLIFFYALISLASNKERRSILSSSPAKWLSAFFLVGAISLLVNIPYFSSSQIGEASLYLLRFIMYSGVVYLFSQLHPTLEKYKDRVVTIIGALLITFGFVQYFYYNNLRNVYYLGWDDHMYRVFSVFLDPNFTGILFALFSFFLMGRLWEIRSEKRRVRVWGVTFLYGLSLVATVMTFSRSALIALAVGSIVFLTLISRKKYIFTFFGVMTCMLLLATPFFYIENVNLFRAASTEARVESARNALLISKDHLLTGIGFNTYRYVQIQYGFRHGVGAEVSHADSGTDNSYLFVLATTGVIGLIIYGAFLRSLLITAWVSYTSKKSLSSMVFFTSLIAVMVDSLFINSLFYPFVIVWLWMLWGSVVRNVDSK